MPFQLSPGVNVTEIDLTTVIPAVATTDAAIGGVFKWGPVGKPSLVVSEEELANVYGRPDSDNAETFFTAASFLAYSNRLYVSRAHHSTGDDDRFGGYVTNGDNYIAINANTTTGIEVGDIVPAIISGVPSNARVTAVNTAELTATVADANTDLNDTTGIFTWDGAFPLKNGEAVVVTGSDLPSGINDGDTVYIRSVNSSANTFAIATSESGSAIVNFADRGNGLVTFTRNTTTRISINSAFTGTEGLYDFEIHDAEWSFNAIANSAALDSDALLSQHIVKNEDHYSETVRGAFDDNVRFVAKYPGALGNSLKVSVCDSATAFESYIDLVADDSLVINVGANTGTISGSTSSEVSDVVNALQVGDLIKVGNSEIGIQYLEITALPTVTANSHTINFGEPLVTTENISISGVGGQINRYWGYFGLVDGAPGQSGYVAANGNTAANDEMHVVVIDEDGDISGIPGTIMEVWQGLSRATDAKDSDGGAIYYKEVLNQASNWIWFANDSTTAVSNTALNVTSSSATVPLSMSFGFGRDIGAEGSTEHLGDILRAYDLFKSAEDYDISLVLAGKSFGGSNISNGRTVVGYQLANYLIDNIAERRKDCVVFCSPDKDDVVNNTSDITEDVVDFRNQLRSSSYAVLDSGYKYMYDKYNDVYRWIPINGDIAGLCAYTDDSRDPWWSPAGFNRGNLKSVVKLAWNPKKAERDILYKNGVNPIVNFPGQGIVMFGDKTLLAKPSAFDRINVRRLFIVLEKAIATAAKFTLFEFNDEFTRASFVNLVTPYLRDVQGRRGITDFTVICDETNNTGEVIDRNEFIGDIYIKPARSINFIQLNFVAVRTGVEFSEVIGQF